MKKPLLEVVFASEKRKTVLLLLGDGPKRTEVLLRSLDTTRQSLLPQLRILEDNHLIHHPDDSYELTDVGKIIVEGMRPLLETVEAFDNDIAYWGQRKLDFIPFHLLNRISELGKCSIVNPPLTDIYSIQEKFLEANKGSDSVFVVTTFFFPNYNELFSEMIGNNVNIHFIISSDLLRKLQIKNDTGLKEIIRNRLVHLSVYNKEMEFISFAFNDRCTLMRILKSGGENDHKLLVCIGPGALGWIKELFEYYSADSTPVTEI